MVEIFIVISVMAVITLISFSVYRSWQNQNVINSARQIVAQAMREAQFFAAAGKNDSEWGVKISNNQIIIFSGASFLTRNTGEDKLYDLPYGVEIIDLSEMVFNKSTGFPKESLSSTIKYGGRSAQIKINSQGIFSY